MANSYIEYNGNGVRDTYLIPFGFLAKSNIQATIDEVETVDFEVVGNSVVFDTPPALDTDIKILRVTPRKPVVTLVDGASPNAEQMNKISLQSLYVSQELEDGTISGTQVIPNNSLTVGKLQQIPIGSWLGRVSSLTGDVEVLTTAQLKSELALGGAALLSVGTTAGTVAAGNDTRITTAIKQSEVGTGLEYSGGKINRKQVGFRAYNNATQSYTSGEYKVLFNTESFDTDSMFSSSRFTPTIAGYYLLGCTVNPQSGTLYSGRTVTIKINGSTYIDVDDFYSGRLDDAVSPFRKTTGATTLYYFNGTTDYAEVAFGANTALTIESGNRDCNFWGFLI